MVNFANLPNLRFYAPKAARSDRKFTNLPFYGFTASSFSRSSTLIHYAFTHLPFYAFAVFSCSHCPRKNINLQVYGFTLVSFASTPSLRFYAFTALLPFPAHALHKEHEFTNFTEFTFARTQQNLPLYRFTPFTMALRAVKFTSLPIYQIYRMKPKSSR